MQPPPIPAPFYLQPLSWHQIGPGSDLFELRAIGAVAGLLAFSGSRTARAVAPDGAWVFAPRGILRPGIEIRTDPGGSLSARYQPAFWGAGGTIDLAPHPPLRVDISGFDTAIRLSTAEGRTVLSYDLRGLALPHAPLRWGDHPAPAGSFPWLVHFTWYLGVLHFRELISAGAAVIP